MKRIAIVAALLATSPAFADDAVSFDYENFYRDPGMGRARIILKVENNATSTIQSVTFECAFLGSDGKALDTAIVFANNVRPGEPAYVDGWSAQISGIDKAQCRISRVR